MEDIELNRNNEGYLNAVGAQRIPDPTTAGDFTRRFTPEDIGKLMESINTVRSRVWTEGRKEKLKEALIDVDGTIAGTYGECKGGMNISHKGICAADSIACEYEGGIVPGESFRECSEPRWVGKMDRSGDRGG